MPAKRLRTETHCPHGHLWADGNAYHNAYDGGLSCRECNRLKVRAWYIAHGRRAGEYKPREHLRRTGPAKPRGGNGA